MHVTYSPVRVIHWDRPSGSGYALYDVAFGVRLAFDGVTIDDELFFKLEERLRVYNKGTKVQVASWIAEREMLVKFNEGPKLAMSRCLSMLREAHEHFNDKYVESNK